MATSERSILAEMALQFVEQREVLATSALGHLLRRSPEARQAVRDLMPDRGVALPPDLVYQNEQIEPGAEGRPDVVGMADGQRWLILEGKFWAALTDAQPVYYAKSLAPRGGLLFVAPAKRTETLWAELLTRCGQAGWPIREQESQHSPVRLSEIRESWWLGIVSWRELLDNVRRALEAGGHHRLVADVDQLASLCEMEDDDAFLPLTSVDLAQPTPIRIYQFMDLVARVQQRGFVTGLFQKSGLRSGGSMGQYRQYIAAGPYQIALFVDFKRWATQRMTPLWLEIAVDPGDTLTELQFARPPKVFYDGYARRPVVPLMLPLHAELDGVVEDVISQIGDVLARVKDRPPTVRLNIPEPQVDTESEADEVSGPPDAGLERPS